MNATNGLRFAVAQLGARRHYAVPRALESCGALGTFFTDTCANGRWFAAMRKYLPTCARPRLLRKFLDRVVPDLESNKIQCFHRLAVLASLRSQRRHAPRQLYERYLHTNRRFGQLVVRRGMRGVQGVYVFNGAGLEILQHAKERGWVCVVDQTMSPIDVVESMLAEERRRWPGWDLAAIDRDDWLPLAQRERAEWELADKIICGSDFVVAGISKDAGPVERCAVVEYGSFAATRGNERRADDARGEFRVLFVGTVGLRKGIPYLLEAARLLRRESIRIRVVGPIQVSVSRERELRESVEVVGPVPRSEVANHFRWADALVLPTLAEGSANVCFEALASGLPVITTPNAGSIVRNGQDGFIVPSCHSELLAERILQLADDHQLWQEMSASAARRSMEHSMSDYATRLVGELRNVSSVKASSCFESVARDEEQE